MGVERRRASMRMAIGSLRLTLLETKRANWSRAPKFGEAAGALFVRTAKAPLFGWSYDEMIVDAHREFGLRVGAIINTTNQVFEPPKLYKNVKIVNSTDIGRITSAIRVCEMNGMLALVHNYSDHLGVQRHIGYALV